MEVGMRLRQLAVEHFDNAVRLALRQYPPAHLPTRSFEVAGRPMTLWVLADYTPGSYDVSASPGLALDSEANFYATGPVAPLGLTAAWPTDPPGWVYMNYNRRVEPWLTGDDLHTSLKGVEHSFGLPRAAVLERLPAELIQLSSRFA